MFWGVFELGLSVNEQVWRFLLILSGMSISPKIPRKMLNSLSFRKLNFSVKLSHRKLSTSDDFKVRSSVDDPFQAIHLYVS